MIYRMQVHIVKQMPSVKAGYIDPQAIAQTNFNYPKQWKLDDKELLENFKSQGNVCRNLKGL